MSKIIHMRKTVNVDVQTWKKLQKLKIELAKRSLKEVINFLVDAYERRKN